MNYHRYFSADRPVVEACVIGTGGFGRSFLAQGLRVPLMRVRVAVDINAQTAAAGMQAAGIERSRIRLCETSREAAAAFAAGDFVAAGDLASVIDLPIDIVAEATGQPEAGARHCSMAIEAGWHLALVSKEVDSVIGPGLAYLAAAKGSVVTPVDGDQPSLLIGLVTWAETLGFEIVAAGKASEYDFVFDARTGYLSSEGTQIHTPGFADCLVMGKREAIEITEARARAAAEFPQRAIPDLCELSIVANATGLLPDRPDLHAPIARINEVPTLFSVQADGGLFAGERRLDVFHCLRAPDEVSFAGGVLVVVRCTDQPTWEILAGKGHIVSRSGATAMIYMPRHLLGLEAATSMLDAAIHGASSGATQPRPHVDLIARAQEELPAGTVLSMGGHHHAIANVSSEIIAGAPLGSSTPAPFYLAANRKLARTVPKGQMITLDDLEIDSDSLLLALRRKQDALFFENAREMALAEEPR